MAEELQGLLNRIQEDGLRKSEEERNRIVSEAEAKAAKIISDAQAKIQKDKENAIQEIRNEVAQLSISIAEKVLKKELSDKKAQNAYIETLLKENKNLS